MSAQMEADREANRKYQEIIQRVDLEVYKNCPNLFLKYWVK